MLFRGLTAHGMFVFFTLGTRPVQSCFVPLKRSSQTDQKTCMIPRFRQVLPEFHLIPLRSKDVDQPEMRIPNGWF